MNYTESEWNGYRRLDFIFEDKKAILIVPGEKSNGKWLFKTVYFGAYPSFELEMLGKGYHVAYVENSTRWYKEEDSDRKARFCDFLHSEFGLEKKCLPVGMSCGGMHAVYFAARYPEYVAAVYLDAPVLNLLSCPLGIGVAGDSMKEEFFAHTGMTVSELINYRNHPIDNVPLMIKSRIPVFLVCGDSDTTVPYSENGKMLAELYRKSDVPFFEFVKRGCDHHPHGLEDNTPLTEFAKKFY